ncbi:MAG: sigma-70 family RNA polymerase sigma factor, partial [Nannocystaceae bacterium]|nr:sigma-70 family RNA polymerase sigma factor [Nannocystaceae bacterium]
PRRSPVSFIRSAQFRRLYSRHFRLVWSVVGQLGMRDAAREDAAQEIWIVVVRRLHTLDPQASERAWLCAIARKVVWRLRRTTRRFDARVAAFADAPRCAPADASTRYEAATTAAEALRSLSDAQRSVLVLTLVHGFTAPEVSAALELPLNTVYSRLRLARARLAAFDVKRRALEAALDSGEQAPAGVRGRVLAAVLPWVRVPWVAASTLKAFAMGGVLGGVLVTASTPAPGPPVAALRPPVLAQLGPLHALPGRVDRPLDVHLEPSTAVVDPAAPVMRPRVRREAAPPEPEPIAAPPAPLLDDESRLLGRAQRALRGKQPKQALRLLRQHELQFSNGRLGDVRDGVFVRALCALGRTEEAMRMSRRLATRRPGSAIATAVEDVCAQADDGSKPARR